MTMVLRPGADLLVRSALFGVQFRDAGNGRVVADGLQVQMQSPWHPARQRALVPSRSGVFVLHDFPGMPRFDGDAPADSPPLAHLHTLTVADTQGRFLPLRLDVPLPSHGLHGTDATSPADLPPHVPLYSAATRAVPPGQAALRAELRRSSGEPLPWAWLELWRGSTRIAEGAADGAGRALLVFALPAPRPVPLRASPAAAPNDRWTWPLDLRAFWHPDRQPGTVPDLDELRAQPEVALLDASDPPAPLGPLTLTAGETLVARSAHSSFLYVAA